MKEAIRLLGQIVDSGRSYAKRGLLYEAAYRYGQAVAMINMLYILHQEEVLKLSASEQSVMAQLHEKLDVMSISLGKSAGNGHHKLSGAESDAKQSLLEVMSLLREDLEWTPN